MSDVRSRLIVMTLNLDHVLARVHSAQAHRAALCRIHAEYRKQHPLKQFHKISGNTAHMYVQATHPFPHQMSIEFGEWANGLRAALDSLFYEIAIFDTGTNPPSHAVARQFPILHDEAKFDSQGSLKGLHPWTVKQLRNCQPFNSPTGENGNALYWLHELARIDRHRHLYEIKEIILGIDVTIPAAIAPYTAKNLITLCDEKTSFIRHDDPLELATIAFHTPIPPFINSGIDMTYSVGFDIPGWLLEVHEGYQWRCDHRMVSVEEMVEKLILLFSHHIENRTELEGTISYIDGEWVNDYE